MKSGILLSKAKLQWINEVVFSKEIVNSVVYLFTGTTLAKYSIAGKAPLENVWNFYMVGDGGTTGR